MKPAEFIDPSLAHVYEAEDYHGLFFGETMVANGIEAFRL